MKKFLAVCVALFSCGAMALSFAMPSGAVTLPAPSIPAPPLPEPKLDPPIPEPIPAPNPNGTAAGFSFRVISAGRAHTCGIMPGGSAWCWGDNSEGQLGNGTLVNSSVPVPVAGGGTWTSISAGAYQTCGIMTTGTAWCWGANYAGQLGDSTFANSQVPVLVVNSTTNTWLSISAGGWDQKSHSCGIKSDNTLWCWGSSGFGQRGDGTTSSVGVPVQEALGLPKWTKVTAGAYHSCGLLTNGTGWCWGANFFGQLGNGTNVSSLSPVPVTFSGMWRTISAGGTTPDLGHTCAIDMNNKAYCWGYGMQGQLGNGSTAAQLLPTPIVGFWREISAGGLHSCGIRQFGRVWCWGQGTSGQIGNGAFASSLTPLITVGTMKRFAIDAGGAHNAEIRISTLAWTWGLNGSGQLGNGTLTNSPIPVLV